jgi:hypothetical protein
MPRALEVWATQMCLLICTLSGRSLGPVNTSGVACAGSQFFSIRGVRNDAYRGPRGRVFVRGVDTGCLLATIDEEMRKTGPGLQGCGANWAIHCCRFRLWTRHSLQTPPSLSPRRRRPVRGGPGLARFSLATPAASVLLTGPSSPNSIPRPRCS